MFLVELPVADKAHWITVDADAITVIAEEGTGTTRVWLGSVGFDISLTRVNVVKWIAKERERVAAEQGMIVGTLNTAPDAKTVEQHRELEALTRDYEVQHKALIDVSRELNLALEERRVRIAELDKIKAEHRNAQECVDQMTNTADAMAQSHAELEQHVRNLEEENKMLRSGNESFQQDREELRMLREENSGLRTRNKELTERIAKVRDAIMWVQHD